MGFIYRILTFIRAYKNVKMKQDFFGKAECEVWNEFKNGSRDAYTYIYATYAPVLYNYGYKIVPDQTLVEDCIQDLFEHLLRSRRNLGDTDSIKFYLFKALRREITGKLTRAYKGAFAAADAADPDFHVVFSYETSLVEEELGRERQENLVKALNDLPARQKEAVFLRFYDNLSYEQIAAIMGIDTHSVYKTIYKAIASLQKRMDCALGLTLLLTQMPGLTDLV
jgi:RNA polymerase sigma-70 factor (ECF subfamily)